MSSTVSFYILQEAGHDARLAFCCRLVETIQGRGHSIYIHAADEAMAQELDELLWSFRPESFIPHMIVGTDVEEEDVPVLIGYQPDLDEAYSGAYQVLLNLHPEVPAFYAQFSRIAEIISADESCKASGREHWQFYKSKACELQAHEV